MKWMFAVLMAAACSSKSDDKPAAKPATVEITWAPRVSTASVLATSSEPPPPVIVIDAAGNGYLASIATWDALSTTNPATGAEPVTGTGIALLNPRFGPRSPITVSDDDGDDGGSGSELLRIAGGATLDKRYEQTSAPMPLHKIIGEVKTDGQLTKSSGLLLAAPTAKATTVVDIIAKTNAAIGVVHENKIRPLRLDFADQYSSFLGRGWMELRVGPKEMSLEAVPDVPTRTDVAGMRTTLEQVRAGRGLDPRARVDVLVEADTDAQRLVDALVALDQAGALVIGLGHAPAADSEDAKRRGTRRPTVWFGLPSAIGDLDKALIRQHVRAQHVAFTACHTKLLATKPTLAGTVHAEFVITPEGKVTANNARGVDPELATCVKTIIGEITFPKPGNGGSAQVSYPLTFRP